MSTRREIRATVRPVAVCLLLVAAARGQDLGSAQAIEAARRSASQLQREGRYAEEVALRLRIYEGSRRVHGANHAVTGGAAFDLGQAHLRLGEYDQVEPRLTEAVRILRAAGTANDPNVAAILNALATYYDRIGQVVKADRCYSECVRILTAARSPERLSVVRYNMATMYRRVGLGLRAAGRLEPDPARRQDREGKASAAFERARDVLRQEIAFVGSLRRAPNDFRLHNREMVLGQTLLDLGDFAAADALFSRCKEFSDRTDGRDTHGLDLLDLAHSRCALGRHAESLEFARKAVALSGSRLGALSPQHLLALALEARALGHLGRFEEAGAAMDRCRRLEREYLLRVFPALSETEQLSWLSRRDYGENHFDLALALAASAGGAKPLALLSAGWILNRKALAHEMLAERAALARDLARPDTGPLATRLRETRAAIAQLVSRLGAFPEESAEFRETVARLAEALRLEAEQSKDLGRAAGRGSRPDWIDPGAVRAALPPGAILVEFARFDAPALGGAGAAAIAGSPRYGAWLIPAEGGIGVVDLGDAAPIEAAVRRLREAVPRDVKAITEGVIAEANRELEEFARANGLAPGSAEHQRKLGELRAAIGARISARRRERRSELLGAWERDSAECARLLLHPLLDRVSSASLLLLSPDAQLWGLPFGALPLPGGGCLLDRVPLLHLVTGRDLLSGTGAPAASPPLLVGDIDYDGGVLAPEDRVEHPAAKLWNSAAEIRAIRPHAETLAGSAAVVLLGAEAQEARLKAARGPRLLFLSTHGAFGAVDEAEFQPGETRMLLENPLLRCHLSFAGCNRKAAGGGDDGRLYGIEAAALDLRGTDLVVLSACQTALGDVHAGQSAAGLRQAFQLAGAKAVAATLWSVDDAATTRLTVEFLERLAAGASGAEALRGAQRSVAADEEYAHPFFWAAFTLTRRGS